MTTPKNKAVEPDSLAGGLLEAGAAPVQPDLAAMQAQLDAMTAAYNKLMAERGIPTDPVAAAITDLKQHVDARVTQNPSVDLSALANAVTALVNKGDNVTSDDIEAVKIEFDDLQAGTIARCELPYVGQLINSVRRELVAAR